MLHVSGQIGLNPKVSLSLFYIYSYFLQIIRFGSSGTADDYYICHLIMFALCYNTGRIIRKDLKVLEKDQFATKWYIY